MIITIIYRVFNFYVLEEILQEAVRSMHLVILVVFLFIFVFIIFFRCRIQTCQGTFPVRWRFLRQTYRKWNENDNWTTAIWRTGNFLLIRPDVFPSQAAVSCQTVGRFYGNWLLEISSEILRPINCKLFIVWQWETNKTASLHKRVNFPWEESFMSCHNDTSTPWVVQLERAETEGR